MKNLILFLIFSLLVTLLSIEESFSQTMDSISLENGQVLSLSTIGAVSIITKKEGIKKNCTIKEINSSYVVYEKDGSLHDILIQKIDRIETEPNNDTVIFFNSVNKPMIRGENGSASNSDRDRIIKNNGDVIYCSITKVGSLCIFYTENGTAKKILKNSIRGYEKDTSLKADSSNGSGKNKMFRNDARASHKGNGAFGRGVAAGVLFPYGGFFAHRNRFDGCRGGFFTGIGIDLLVTGIVGSIF